MYQLIDFGNGRKLESFGGRLVDRPSPAAETFRPRMPERWKRVDSYYDARSRKWIHSTPWPEQLVVDFDDLRLPAYPSPFGHVGIFPEQQTNWQWLRAAQPQPIANPVHPGAKRLALNLFAYTGASTVAMSRAGFDVVHVDAAKPNVLAAKRTAMMNDLSAANIRYLVDDAAVFVAREIRRKRTYHTIVLDPPAYGHSPKGKTWRIERDLWPLLEGCLQLVAREHFRLLVTGHSPQVDAPDIADFFQSSSAIANDWNSEFVTHHCGRSELTDLSGRQLDTGFFVRLERRQQQR